ncbi:Fic family protein [Candidatus Saccharibacteria bacterium]|nr:Fic family protein [Candidatus Saccharibacteria bacterium]
MEQMPDKFRYTTEESLFLAKKVLVGNIYNTAKIEGVNTTFPETETIIDGVNVPTASLDDIKVILNLRDAWRFVINNIDNEIDLEFIEKINENVSRNESLEWGKLRSGEIGISGTNHKLKPPVRSEIIAGIANIDKLGISATDRSIKTMLFIMYNQLFWDGNKRTAIITANAILIKAGAGVLTIEEKNLGEFNQSLSNYYNHGNGDELERFLYDKCIKGLAG